MKLPAYGRNLLKRRTDGKPVSFVVVAAGALIDTRTLSDLDGVSRIGVPADAVIGELDFSAVIGLDVVVSFWGETPDDALLRVRADRENAKRDRELLMRIWLHQPGTLWVANEGHARQMAPFNGRLLSVPPALPLNAGFRARVSQWRRESLIDREGIFARPEFDELRAAAIAEREALRERVLGHATV